MDVAIFDMEPERARDEYAHYRLRIEEQRRHRREQRALQQADIHPEQRNKRVLKSQLEYEDEELARAYLELSRGRRVLCLPQAMVQAGIDSQYFLPKLAVARASEQFVWFDNEAWGMSGDVVFRTTEHSWRPPAAHVLRFPKSLFPRQLSDGPWRRERKLPNGVVRTFVPAVPARHRPADDLSRYHILWEVERWDLVPPTDPILLRRVSSSMYVVEAQWDLTPLEQAVLALRPFPQ